VLSRVGGAENAHVWQLVDGDGDVNVVSPRHRKWEVHGENEVPHVSSHRRFGDGL
jgi:hypothetical protein